MVLVCGLVPVGIILPVYAQDEYIVFPETATVSSSNLPPLDFKLKAISKQSGEVQKVSGFRLDPVNVLDVSSGGVISAISTDESMVFEQARAKSSTDSLFELQKATIQGQLAQPQLQSNSGFSIAGLAPGVYTLDLIGNKNGDKAAYEGILVIAQDKESPQVKQAVEKKINEGEQDTTIVDVITIFQTPPAPLQPQPQPQLLPQTGPIARQLPPGGTGPLGTQPQQLAAIPQGSQGPTNQSLAPSPSPTPTPTPPQALAAQLGQCQEGFEGIPPQCTPIEPGNEPIDLLSLDPSLLDPSGPLFGEPGVVGATGEGDNAENLENTDRQASGLESESEGSDEGEEGGDEGDEGDDGSEGGDSDDSGNGGGNGDSGGESGEE